MSALPQRALVTGASRGIGRAIAQALLARGVRLALVGRDRSTLAEVIAGREGHAVIDADLARLEDAEACVERALAALGGLDAVVSCAGIVEYVPLGAITAVSLERQLRVNFCAPFVLAQRAIEPLARSSTASMLFVASTLGLKPEAPMTAAYAASKAALISATRSFALELGARGIRVNAIAPGVVDTEMVRAVRGASGGPADADALQAQLEFLRRLHPLGRLGQPEDVAETALYLLAAPYVTGAIVPVDGGLLLGRGQP